MFVRDTSEVCKDNFGDVEASVVCGELGLTSWEAQAAVGAVGLAENGGTYSHEIAMKWA